MITRKDPLLVIVGINPVGAKYFAKAARDAGCVPVVLNKPDGYVGQLPMSCAYLHADIDDPAAVSTVLRSQAHLLTDSTIVTSPFDEIFPVLLAATRGLKVKVPDQIFAKLADKAFVSSLVPEYSPATVQLDPTRLPQRIPEIAARKLILKPSLYTGGQGVTAFDRDTVTVASLHAAISTSGVPKSGSQRWLLQEFIDGDLMSLEGYFKYGRLHVIGYSLRTRVGKTASTNIFPVDVNLSARIRTRAEEALCALASRAGFINGYFHAEFMMTENDVYLIDANMGRLSGAVLMEQFSLAHGVDAGSILVHSLLLPFEPQSEAPRYKPSSSLPTTVAYLYGLRHGGVIRSLHVPPEGPGHLHTRYVPDGQYVPPVSDSGYTRVGMISGFRDDCDAFIKGIRIMTDDGEKPAYLPA